MSLFKSLELLGLAVIEFVEFIESEKFKTFSAEWNKAESEGRLREWLEEKVKERDGQ